jgi:hypothetical protein
MSLKKSIKTLQTKRVNHLLNEHETRQTYHFWHLLMTVIFFLVDLFAGIISKVAEREQDL